MIVFIEYFGITLMVSLIIAFFVVYFSIESSERKKHGIHNSLALLWILVKGIYWDRRISYIMECNTKFIIYLLTQYQAYGRYLRPRDLEFISAKHENISIRNAAMKILIANYGFEREKIIRKIIKRQLKRKNTPEGIISNYDYYEDVLESQKSES